MIRALPQQSGYTFNGKTDDVVMTLTERMNRAHTKDAFETATLPRSTSVHTRGASATTPSPRASHLRARSVPFVRDTGLPWIIPFPVTSGQMPLPCQARVAPHCPSQEKTPSHHQRHPPQGAPLAEEVTEQERERPTGSFAGFQTQDISTNAD